MLEVKNLSVSVGGKAILDDLSLTVKDGEVAAIMGPNGSGKSTLSYAIAGKPDYEVTGGDVLLDGESLLDLTPNERAVKGAVSRLPVSGRNSRRRDHDFSQGRAQRAAPRAGRGGAHHARLHAPGALGDPGAQGRSGDVEAPGQRRLLRRREEAPRNSANVPVAAEARGARRDRFRSRHRCAESRRRRGQRAAESASARSSSSPTISGCSTT